MITGTFNRSTLKLTPDRPDWAASVLANDTAAASHYAYDYGAGRFPKTYVSQDGRRISWRWISGPGSPVFVGQKQPWYGMQSVPVAITQNPATDDATTLMLSNPVTEIESLRVQPALARLTGQALAKPFVVPGVTTRHYDAVVTFRGLSALSEAELGALSVGVGIFAPTNGNSSSGWRAPTISWVGTEVGAAAVDGWVAGQVTAAGCRFPETAAGPLALRKTTDTLTVRVLVDGSVIESFWGGGRARITSRSYPPAAAEEELGMAVSASTASISADIEVFAMSSAWLEPVV